MAVAREAMNRRDYGATVGLLREALARQSANVEAHYRLAVSTSHLDRLEEAGREFEWVVAHGQSGAPEVQLAHEWLASRTVSTVSAPSVLSVQDEAPLQNPELASLSEKAVGPDRPMARLQLFSRVCRKAPSRTSTICSARTSRGTFSSPTSCRATTC